MTVTDQALKNRRSVTDALGRLARVDEPDVQGNLTLATDYTYDVLNNLRIVQQGGQTRNFVYDALSRLTSASNPESGIVSYDYDNNGNLKTKIDARNVMTTYVYDELNRVKTRSYAGETSGYQTPAVNYTYDGAGSIPAIANSLGRLTKVTNGISSTEYTAFDALGRVKASRQTTSINGINHPYDFSYTYDLAGNLKTETYPSGIVVTQS